MIIAMYSVVDGEGARIAGPDAAHAFAYNAWSDGLRIPTQSGHRFRFEAGQHSEMRANSA